MSNLSRKIKKATESPQKAAERSKRRYEKRMKALSKPKFPWPSISHARVWASQNLPKEVSDKCIDKNGVFNLDLLTYAWHCRWLPETGWFATVEAELRNDV